MISQALPGELGFLFDLASALASASMPPALFIFA
jgi:hypothetical protein